MTGDETRKRLLAAGASPELVDTILSRREAGDIVPLLRFVLLRALWQEVVDETSHDGQPTWVRQWLELEESGFPFIDVPALRRLRDAGADLDDLTAVVRSAQVLLIYNVACMLDEGSGTMTDLLGDLASGASWQLVARSTPTEERPSIIGGLHDSLEELDPAGRHGEPRTIEERTLSSMPSDVREQVVVEISAGRMAHAALLWRKETGTEQASCLAAVESLAGVLRLRGLRGSAS